MAIMTSEAEDELGGSRLHTTLARGAASGMFQGEGTTRKNPSPPAGNCLSSLAKGKAVPRGRSIQGNWKEMFLRKALGRGWCQKMPRNGPFKEKPGKDFSLGSAVAPTNPPVSPVSRVLTEILGLPDIKSKFSACNRDRRAGSTRNGPCLLQALPIALPSYGVSPVLGCIVSSPDASLPSRSPLVCIFPLGTGGANTCSVKDGEPCSGALRTSWCFWLGLPEEQNIA